MTRNGQSDVWHNVGRWWTSANVSRRAVVGAGAATIFGTGAQLEGAQGPFVVLAALLAFGAGALYPPSHQHRHRNLTGALSIVVGAAAIGLLVASLVAADPDREGAAETKPTAPGIAAIVDYAGDNADPCQAIVFDEKPKVSQPGKDADRNDTRTWLKASGGSDGSETHIRINLQGTTSIAVAMQDMQVHVIRRLPASAKYAYLIGAECGGLMTSRLFKVDLDKAEPKAVGFAGKDESGNTIDPASFPMQVASTDPEIFLVDASTIDCDCTWELIVHWTSQGKVGQTIIRDPQGKPFVTRAVPEGAPQYLQDENGAWQRFGSAINKHTMLATEGWRATYPEYKPKSAWLSGDSTLQVKNMIWPVWNKEEADGMGTGALNNCIPNCAEGKLLEAPIHIHLSKLDDSCGSPFFGQIDVEWTAEVPDGDKQNYTLFSEPPSCS